MKTTIVEFVVHFCDFLFAFLYTRSILKRVCSKLTIKLPITTIVVCFVMILKVIFANSVDPDQTAPLGAVWSGSTLFACMQK